MKNLYIIYLLALFIYSCGGNETKPLTQGTRTQRIKSNPTKKLEKAYHKKLVEARDMQRSGDVKQAALLYEAAEKLADELEILQKSLNK